MVATYILLWLEGPMQSWGHDSVFGVRNTLDFPTKSGVLGMVLCAMGKTGEQTEVLKTLSVYPHTVLAFHKVSKSNNVTPPLKDFHMVGSGYDEKDPWQNMHIPKTIQGKKPVGGGSRLTIRNYLQDMVFAVIIECDTANAKTVTEAFKNPVYTIYLGRKNCMPTALVYRGEHRSEDDALNHAREIAQEYNTSHQPLTLKEEFMVKEGRDDDGDVITLNDVPIQFGIHKKYRDRKVTIYKTNET